jgi:ferredoxin-2, mitochondrial
VEFFVFNLLLETRKDRFGTTHLIMFIIIAALTMAETVAITYVEADGTEKQVQAEVGKNLMQVAHDNNVELEGNTAFGVICVYMTRRRSCLLNSQHRIRLRDGSVGACGGELACSTCHLIFTPEIYATLPEKDAEEDDMLDLAFGVSET